MESKSRRDMTASTGRVTATAATDQTGDLTSDHPLIRWAVGVVTVTAVALVVSQHRADPFAAIWLSVVVTAYGFLSAIDIAQQRLPNRITLPLAGVTILIVFAGGLVTGNITRTLTAITIGLGFSVLLVVFRFGMGDVKLAVTVGTIAAWLGRDAIVATIYIGAAAGAVAALVLMMLHRRRDITFGFGPFLALGSVAGMLVAG
jgi:leader peptidase (prepilin peptidase)/N-methyltransferase